MHTLGESSLYEVFAAWGAHELNGRYRGANWSMPADDPIGTKRRYVEFCLCTRSPMVARIFGAIPITVNAGRLEPSDIPRLVAFNGWAADKWTNHLMSNEGVDGKWIRVRAAGPDRIEGPLVCLIRESGADAVRLVIFDGCHRLAAWIIQCRDSEPYPISAYLVRTRDDVPLFIA